MAQAINSGYRAQIQNVSITDSAWAPVTFTDKVNNLCIRFRGEEGEVKVSLDDAGTNYFTIPNGQAFTMDWYVGKDTAVYLQAGVVASGVAEVFATFD